MVEWLIARRKLFSNGLHGLVLCWFMVSESESRFYFCEKCGKRITLGDIARGEGYDKKVMGIFCRECAEGVQTIEFTALSQAKALEIIKANESHPPDAPTTESLASATPKKHSSSRVRPASSSGSARISRRVAGNAADVNSTMWVTMGSIGVGIGISILFLVAFTGGSEPTAPRPRKKADGAGAATLESLDTARNTSQSAPAQASPHPIKVGEEDEKTRIQEPAPKADSSGFASATLQDGLNGYTGTRDTYLDNPRSTDSFGRSGILQSTLAPGNKVQRTILIQFAIFEAEGGPIPGPAEIESATLLLYLKDSSTAGVGIAPYRMLRRWHESLATGRLAMNGVPWSMPFADGPGADIDSPIDPVMQCSSKEGWFNLDVTESVRAFAKKAPNYGWRLYSKNPSYNTKTFLSRESKEAEKRPKLVILFRSQ